MKQFFSTLILFFLFFSGLTQVRVKGYYRKNGTYVPSHIRSSPDGNPINNYSYPGNINPYTGRVAPGSPTTYLNNYYNNSTSSSSVNLSAYNFAKTQNYTVRERTYNYTSYSLYSANYYRLATSYTRYNSYKVNDSYGYTVGYISANSFYNYSIYDTLGNQLGTVKTTKRGCYTVYDSNKHKIYTNKPKGKFIATALGVVITIGLLTLLTQY